MRGDILFPKPRLGPTTNHYNFFYRHFELVIFRQQKRTTAKSTDWEGDYPIQADFAENTNTATAARVAAREEAAIGQYRQRKTSTHENKQYDQGRRTADPFISAW